MALFVVFLACRRRAVQVAADLHRQLLPALADSMQLNLVGLAGPQRVSGQAHVAQGGGEPDPGYPAAEREFHAVQQAAQLRAPLGAEERVQLVDHDVLQAGEQRADCRAAHDEQRLE